MFEKNHIIPDSMLEKYTQLDVEGLLKSIGSPLAGYSINGELVSAMITQACTVARIDPRFILTKLQVEQSLLHQAPTKERLEWALGYGCPDNGPHNEKYRGLGNQIKAAALGIKSYLSADSQYYVGGYVGKEWKVKDGAVQCKNIATAALYRYTPWIGEKDYGGNKAPFGNYLFYKVWTGLFGPMAFNEAEPEKSDTWRIIAPPDNWREPIVVSERELEWFERLAGNLELRVTKNVNLRKLYLGTAVKSSENINVLENSVRYLSGEMFKIVDDSPWKNSKGSKYWSPHPKVAPPLIEVTEESRKKKLSEHFTLGEFACHDSSYELARVSPKLIEVLEVIRMECGGRPIRINSAYRPHPYNAKIRGAAEDSFHIDGVAADIHIDGVAVSEIGAKASKIVGDGGGVGIYSGDQFVHVDVRGERERW